MKLFGKEKIYVFTDGTKCEAGTEAEFFWGNLYIEGLGN